MTPIMKTGRTRAASGSATVGVVATSAFCSSMSSVTVGIRFNRDGTVDVRDNCNTWSFDHDWCSPTSATVGDDFEVDLDVTSGPNPTSGPSLASFHTISSTRTWLWSATPGEFNSGVWNYEVREIADTGNTDNDNFTWDTEDGS